MRHLSDKALTRLRHGAELPDLSGTRYRLIEPVARGGMGVVYAAEDERLQRRVALKVLEVPGSEGDLANRLMREAQVLARLEHPGIVPVHDAGMLADGRVFYAMKFVEGRRLDQHLESLASVPDRLQIFLRICDAVSFAHARGVLHRDLKPANVMVGPFGEVLVMDWGLAKILTDARPHEPTKLEPAMLEPTRLEPTRPEATDSDAVTLDYSANREGAAVSTASVIPAPSNSLNTGHGSVLGTPGYMSPEQSRGEIELVDARSDIFSLGALLRYLLSEKLLSSSRLDRSLEAICTKACAPEREARYGESIFEKSARFYRRYRFFILLIGAYLLMRVIFVLLVRR
jgi:serine/threonine protein kinase